MDKQNSEAYTIDLVHIVKLLLKKLWIIVLCAIIVGGAFLAYTMVKVAPVYSASCLLYVNNSSLSIGGSSFSISSGELTAAQTLVETYCTILKTRLTLEEVISTAGLNYSYEALSGMVSAASVNETEIFRVTVRSHDAKEACLIANTIAQVLPKKIATIVDGSSVRVVDLAVVNNAKVSPSYSRSLTIGLLVGAVLAAAVIIIVDITSDVIESDSWLTEKFPKYPLLSVVPDDGPGDHSYKYGKYYGRYGKYAKKSYSSRYGYYQKEKEEEQNA